MLRKNQTQDGWWLQRITERALYKDGVYYAAIEYYYLKKLRRILNPKPHDVLFDVGCGMGRVLCVFACKNMTRCIGVEISEELCSWARSNARQMRGRRTTIEVICGDAASIDVSTGTIFVLYNPFGSKTLDSFLYNLRNSVRSNPRYVTVAYYRDVHRVLLEQEEWLQEADHFTTWNDVNVSIWRNVDVDIAAADNNKCRLPAKAAVGPL